MADTRKREYLARVRRRAHSNAMGFWARIDEAQKIINRQRSRLLSREIMEMYPSFDPDCLVIVSD